MMSTYEKRRGMQGGILRARMRLFALAFGALAVGASLMGCAISTASHDDRELAALHEEALKEPSSADLQRRGNRMEDKMTVTRNTTVGDIIELEEFQGFGRLLFPVNRHVDAGSTLEDIAHDGTYAWYSNLDADVFAAAIERLRSDASEGKQVFYALYSEEEREADVTKEDTGLFFFRGNPEAPVAIVNAGGGFVYVAALHDSLPHALELSQRGYNAFALIYRPNHPYEDLARAIEFVHDHAEELQVDASDYSLWGGSAGARMAATLGNEQYLRQLTGRTDIPQASAVIMQYTGYSAVSPYDAPTYACVGTADGIAYWRTMQSRLAALTDRYGIPTEFHSYEGLSHGFGIGHGTVAQGWLDDAVEFWQSQGKQG